MSTMPSMPDTRSSAGRLRPFPRASVFHGRQTESGSSGLSAIWMATIQRKRPHFKRLPAAFNFAVTLGNATLAVRIVRHFRRTCSAQCPNFFWRQYQFCCRQIIRQLVALAPRRATRTSQQAAPCHASATRAIETPRALAILLTASITSQVRPCSLRGPKPPCRGSDLRQPRRSCWHPIALVFA